MRGAVRYISRIGRTSLLLTATHGKSARRSGIVTGRIFLVTCRSRCTKRMARGIWPTLRLRMGQLLSSDIGALTRRGNALAKPSLGKRCFGSWTARAIRSVPSGSRITCIVWIESESLAMRCGALVRPVNVSPEHGLIVSGSCSSILERMTFGTYSRGGTMTTMPSACACQRVTLLPWLRMATRSSVKDVLRSIER